MAGDDVFVPHIVLTKREQKLKNTADGVITKPPRYVCSLLYCFMMTNHCIKSFMLCCAVSSRASSLSAFLIRHIKPCYGRHLSYDQCLVMRLCFSCSCSVYIGLFTVEQAAILVFGLRKVKSANTIVLGARNIGGFGSSSVTALMWWLNKCSSSSSLVEISRNLRMD